MPIHEFGQQAGKEIIAGADDRHVEPASGNTLELRHGVLSLPELLDDAAAVVQHLRAGRGEVDPLAQLLEQRQAHVMFELPNLCGNSGLREMQFLRRARKAQMAGHRFEHFQLAQRGVLHWSISCNL